MHIHDHWPLAGEFSRVGTIEKPGHRKSVKAFDGNQLRFDVLGYIKAAGLAFRPARDFRRFGVNAVSICGAACRGKGNAYFAPLGNAKAVHDASGQAFHDADFAGLRVENFDLAHARFIRSVDDEASIGRNIKCVDVPFFGWTTRRERACFDVHCAKALEIGAFVRCDPQFAIGRKFCTANGDIFLMVANGRHLPARQIEQRHVDIGH